jgi:endoglucanase
VLYEICNEPNGDVQWERDIKPYAQEVIKEIRNIDTDAIIIVGTPTWSQDVDVVAQSPITGYDNIMYTLHFYAATHKEYLRQKLTTALNSGLPVFVTEFGICDASGNGNVDIDEANKWIDFLNENNISWMCWNLSNKNESSALLKNTDKTTNWTEDELSEEGIWLLDALKR